MVGRTPEYLGKKIGGREMKMTMLAILSLPLAMLGFTAVAGVLPGPLAALAASGPRGFSEALYAYVSQAANNGSAFAGLSVTRRGGTRTAAASAGTFPTTARCSSAWRSA